MQIAVMRSKVSL